MLGWLDGWMDGIMLMSTKSSHPHRHTHTHTHAHTQTMIHTLTHPHTHSLSLSHKHSHSHTHTQTQLHPHTHTCTHTHTHTHRHTYTDVLTHIDWRHSYCYHCFLFQRGLDLGLCFSNEFVLPQRGTPGQIFQNFVFWLPLSNERSHRCSEVFVFEIFAFKVFDFISEHLEKFLDVSLIMSGILFICVYNWKQLTVMVWCMCWYVHRHKVFYYQTLQCIRDKKLTKNVRWCVSVLVCAHVCVFVCVDVCVWRTHTHTHTHSHTHTRRHT